MERLAPEAAFELHCSMRLRRRSSFTATAQRASWPRVLQIRVSAVVLRRCVCPVNGHDVLVLPGLRSLQFGCVCPVSLQFAPFACRAALLPCHCHCATHHVLVRVDETSSRPAAVAASEPKPGPLLCVADTNRLGFGPSASAPAASGHRQKQRCRAWLAGFGLQRSLRAYLRAVLPSKRAWATNRT